MKLILAVITTFWINYAVAVPSVELVVPGGTQVPRLQNVTTITCKAREFKSGYLVYIKKQSKEGDPLSLMTNGELDDGFKGGSYEGTHRYAGSYKELSSVENILDFDFHIKITNIEPEDAGTFICEMVNGNDVLARDTTTIVVKVPPTSISMKFTNDSEVIEAETAVQTLHFMPDDTAHFTCIVKGGSPQPSVSVMIGEEDVTSQFELTVKEVMKPGTTQGFEASTFTVTLEAMNFLMVPKYNNKMLVCKSPAGAEPLERRFHIKFPQNAPQVTCHTKDQIVLLYQRDVNISCDVEGDISDSYIYWWRLSTKNMSDPSYRILVRSGEKDDSYTSTLEKSDDGSAKMILHFRRIYPQDIRSYYFFASNSFGAHQDHMKLTKAFAQWEIDVKIEPKEVQIGEPVNISCHLKRHSAPPQLLSVGWKRRIGDEEIQVASNKDLTVLDKNKYSASMDVIENTDKNVYFVFHIKIHNARPQDSGQWGCVHPEDSGAAMETVYRNLTVISQVRSIKLYSRDKDTGLRRDYQDNEEVMMEDGDEMNMTCEVEGGYPRPNVQIKTGSRHADREFTGEPVLKTIGSGTDMKLEYHTLKVAENFVASGHHSSKRLECSANVPAAKSPALKIGILIKIDEFKPVFSCDQDTRLATLYERDVNLTCKVQANPPLTNGTVHFYRKVTPKKKITIVNGQDKNHHVFQILNGTTEEEKIFRLHIGQLFPQSFRTYYFTANNVLGHTVKELKIQPNPAYTVKGNTGASVKGINGAALLGYITMLLLATIFGDLATVPFCW